MELTLLTVPDCPHGPLIEARLAEALTGRAEVGLRRQVVETPEDARRFGMCGSPTLLIDGVDPFAAPGARPGLSCRLYRDSQGHLDGAPTASALRTVLDQAGGRR